MANLRGFRAANGAVAAPPYTHGPYTFSEFISFTGGASFGDNGKGNCWYVSSASGVDTNDGRSWNTPKLTIQAAVTAASAGDTIFLQGTFTEAVTCSTSSLTFIGAGPTVQDNVWMQSATGQTLLTLTGKNCKFYNIKFYVPQTGGIGINMTSADYTVIYGCYFQGRTGSLQAILNNGASHCKIIGNDFLYFNTTTTGCAILGSTYTAIPASWEVAYNWFAHNLRHVSMTMRLSYIHDNLFQGVGLGPTNVSLTATTLLDIYTGSAGNGEYNTVTRNTFNGTNYTATAGYLGNATDNWYGNKSSDLSRSSYTTGEGTTYALPA